MTTLDLSANQLTDLPAALAGLTALKTLKLDHNKLSACVRGSRRTAATRRP